MINFNYQAFFLIFLSMKIGAVFLFYDTASFQPNDITRFVEPLTCKELHKGMLNFQELTLLTSGDLSISVYYFDRKSDNLLILGSGFTGDKESASYFAQLFPSYDIVTFDYRWSKNKFFFIKPFTLLFPISSLLLDEQQEVITVVSYFKKQKKYKQVTGLGICYSAGLFLVAQVNQQSLGNKLFDKLILDSCWLSLKDFACSISKDPFLPLYPQWGVCPYWLKVFLAPIFSFIKLFVSDFSLENYLAKIHSTPLFFLHGQEDKLIEKQTFETIWSLVKTTPKVALLTPSSHSNTIEHEFLYAYLCSNFIEQDYNIFVKTLYNNQ